MEQYGPQTFADYIEEIIGASIHLTSNIAKHYLSFGLNIKAHFEYDKKDIILIMMSTPIFNMQPKLNKHKLWMTAYAIDSWDDFNQIEHSMKESLTEILNGNAIVERKEEFWRKRRGKFFFSLHV